MIKQLSRILKQRIRFIQIICFLSLFIIHAHSLSYKLTMDTTSSSNLISSYNTDVGDCSCDIHPSSCDIYCCCDRSCSSSLTSTWSTQSLCKNTHNTLQRSCDNLNQGTYWSFDDLACVYYSNRGNISYYYSYPDSGSINYPTSDKFAAKISSAQAINVASSTAISDGYSSSQYLVKMQKDNVLKFMEIWSPIADGDCGIGYVNISSSKSFSCSYLLNLKTCASSSSLYDGTINLCKNGNCSSISALPTVNTVGIDASETICNNFITAQQFDITLSSSGSYYTLDSITVTLTQRNIALPSSGRYNVNTIININLASGTTIYSGNPGYLINKAIIVQASNSAYNLLNIADSTGNCATTSNVNTSSSVNILFGQNSVYSCLSTTPCGNSLYIDQIIKQTLTMKKWAKSVDTSIQVMGSGSTVSSCSYQQIIINILYSTAGWVSDTQNYIIGAQITTKQSTDSAWNRKYLRINWIYVDPDTISTPPTNYFYSYFSYIWKPLRQYFGVY